MFCRQFRLGYLTSCCFLAPSRPRYHIFIIIRKLDNIEWGCKEICRPEVNHQNLIDHTIENKITRIVPGLEVTASSMSSSSYWWVEVPEVAALQISIFSRSCLLHRVNQRIRSDYYPEIVGMNIFILGKDFRGLDDAALGGFGAGGGATLDCFGVFSVGTGEDI